MKGICFNILSPAIDLIEKAERRGGECPLAAELSARLLSMIAANRDYLSASGG